MRKCINCRHRKIKGASSYCEISGCFLHYDTVFEHCCKHWAKIKLFGNWKFTGKISYEQPDLSDAKFIDEDGNVTTPADWQDWNETPPWEESEDKE